MALRADLLRRGERFRATQEDFRQDDSDSQPPGQQLHKATIAAARAA
jgi:hypothetical protein